MSGDRPIITVREWARNHHVTEHTALFWAARTPQHLRAYQSPPGPRGTWLTRADQPHPGEMRARRRPGGTGADATPTEEG